MRCSCLAVRVSSHRWIGLRWSIQEDAIMTLQALVIWLVVGGIAGWVAGLIIKGYGLGLIGNIVVGIIGAVIAGWLLPRIGISIGSGIPGMLIHAIIGAVLLLFVVGLVKRR
jgi:uncharacterized membrane protein YeaQ/YmgE (transglycosylase-associated protein family)